MIESGPLSDEEGSMGPARPSPQRESVTQMSGSESDRTGHAGSRSFDFSGLRNLGGLARGLLWLVAAMLSVATSACPLPVYGVDPELNTPPEIDLRLVSPEYGNLVTVNVECDTQPVEFRLTGTVTDAQDDDLIVYWLVDEKDDFADVGQDDLDFTFDPCTHPKATPGADLTLEIVAAVLDEQPSKINVGGVKDAALAAGTLLNWTVIINGGTCVCE